MLSFQNISVTIGEKKILHSITLQFEPGKTYGLIGPNGAGKSTICRVIRGDSELTVTGKIFLEYTDIGEFTLQERFLAGIFVSYQAPVEIPGVTISNLLLKGLNNKLISEGKKELTSSEFLIHVKSIIQQFELPEKIYTWKVNEGLSGGQKKLLEVFQLLVHDMKIIVLDEIDSGLDIDTNKLMIKIIKLLQQDKLKTLIIISHYPQFLLDLAPDTVLVIKEGKIVEEGSSALLTELNNHGYSGFNN